MSAVDTPGTTPLSQLATPQSWWAGVDTEDPETHHNSAGDSDGIATNEDHQDQSTSDVQGEEGLTQHQQRVGGDPKKIFGVLPNSSFNVRYLADPIQREVELQAAILHRRPSVGAPPFPGTEPASTTAAVGEASDASPRGTLGVSNAEFWKKECSRLQGQLESITRDQERRVTTCSLPQTKTPKHDNLGGIHTAVSKCTYRRGLSNLTSRLNLLFWFISQLHFLCFRALINRGITERVYV